MDDFEAAGIIDQAFPKHALLFGMNPRLSVDDLYEALKYAEAKSGNSSLGECVGWARDYFKWRMK